MTDGEQDFVACEWIGRVVRWVEAALRLSIRISAIGFLVTAIGFALGLALGMILGKLVQLLQSVDLARLCAPL